jgi:dinuclear metal center YbgI/SA1388 family protein
VGAANPRPRAPLRVAVKRVARISMLTIQDVCHFLEEFAPAKLAEDWDNVGLLVGDEARPVTRIMTCLTVTPESAAEAIQEQADLVVTHHPFPFRPLKQLTTQTTTGSLLLKLISGGVAVHSPHTAFDSAAAGINQRLAAGLGLSEIRPLVDSRELPEMGSGRRGLLATPCSLSEFAQRVKNFLHVSGLHRVGHNEQLIRSVAVACGSAGSFLTAARTAGCELLVTGETTFHTCLEAQATGIALLLPGHFASERFAVEQLAEVLADQFPTATVWASRSESDPLKWV